MHHLIIGHSLISNSSIEEWLLTLGSYKMQELAIELEVMDFALLLA